MHVISLPDAAAIGTEGAALVARAVRGRTAPVLGVATGSSPLPVYEALRAETGIDWRTVRAFALDEYVGVPADDPHSYAAFLAAHLCLPLGIPTDRVRVPDGTAEDLDREVASYEAAIRAAGGVDLQLLGIGRNGHIAFNEPGTALDSRTRVVALTEDTRAANARFFERPEAVPTHALSQGIGTILEARSILLVASGQDKADALTRALLGDLTPDCPASALQLHHDVTVLTDCVLPAEVDRFLAAPAA